MDFEKTIMDFVEGNLDSVLSYNMEAHIASCPDCAEMAKAHRVIFESLNDTKPVKAPAGLGASILSAINADAPDNVIEFNPSRNTALNPVNCGVFEDNIAAYTDGFLSGDLLRNMDKHKTACTSCESLANAHDLVLASLSSTEPVKAPEGLAARILHAVEADATQTKESFGLVKLIKKYRVFSTAAAAATSLVAASIIIIGGLASYLSEGEPISEGLSVLFSQISAVPQLIQARIVGSIPVEYWYQINLLLKPVEIPYIETSLPMFSIGLFFIVVASSAVYLSLSKSSYRDAVSFDNLV
ncbi:anti-sigma factor family protein [Candidatus Latescibacterota bacterium]